MAKGRIPSASPMGLRSNEHGEVSSQDNSYGFSRAVRGYDPKEVDEYIDNLLDNYRNAQRVLDQNREEFENEKELISCEVNGLKNQRAEWEAKIAEYQAIIDDLTNQMINNSGDGAAKMNQELKDQVRKLENKDAENQEIIDNLSNQLGEAQKVINTLNAKSNSNSREVDDLNAKIRELQSLADGAAEAEAVKLELSTENLKLANTVDDLERALVDLERSSIESTSMIDSLSRENDANIQKVAELSDRLAMLEQSAAEAEQIKADAEALMRQVEESDATIENLRNQLLVVNDMAKENEELRAQIHGFQDQMADYDNVLQTRDALQAQVDSFQADFDKQQQSIDEKSAALDLCVGQLSKLEESISLIQYQIDEAKAKVAEIK